jgi:CheY-like chemotaxis protein
VLVVDDNLDSAESLTVLVEELGHEVRTETEGGKVVEAAREFRPNLILLDISLPDISGFDVAEELRRQPDLADICLVALSGYGQEHHRRRSTEVGFDRYWVKPVDFVALKSLLAGLSLRTPDAPSSRS